MVWWLQLGRTSQPNPKCANHAKNPEPLGHVQLWWIPNRHRWTSTRWLCQWLIRANYAIINAFHSYLPSYAYSRQTFLLDLRNKRALLFLLHLAAAGWLKNSNMAYTVKHTFKQIDMDDPVYKWSFFKQACPFNIFCKISYHLLLYLVRPSFLYVLSVKKLHQDFLNF